MATGNLKIKRMVHVIFLQDGSGATWLSIVTRDRDLSLTPLCRKSHCRGSGSFAVMLLPWDRPSMWQ